MDMEQLEENAVKVPQYLNDFHELASDNFISITLPSWGGQTCGTPAPVVFYQPTGNRS